MNGTGDIKKLRCRTRDTWMNVKSPVEQVEFDLLTGPHVEICSGQEGDSWELRRKMWASD